MGKNKTIIVLATAASAVASVVAVGLGWHRKRKAENEDREREAATKKKSKLRKYDKDGYDTQGYDRDGYDRNGYDVDGVDRAGQNRFFYTQRFEELQGVMEDAWEQFYNDKLGYALHDTGRVLEETVEQCIKHFCGKASLESNICDNINKCYEKKLIGKDIVERVHRARKACNADKHEFDAEFERSSVQKAIEAVEELVEVTFDAIVFQGQ